MDTALVATLMKSIGSAGARHADDGRTEIDNITAWREIRVVAFSQKNWMHADSNAGSERAAATYSMIDSAKLNRIDPRAHLRRVFERIGEHPVNCVEELLPWDVAAQLACNNAAPRLAARGLLHAAS